MKGLKGFLFEHPEFFSQRMVLEGDFVGKGDIMVSGMKPGLIVGVFDLDEMTEKKRPKTVGIVDFSDPVGDMVLIPYDDSRPSNFIMRVRGNVNGEPIKTYEINFQTEINQGAIELEPVLVSDV